MSDPLEHFLAERNAALTALDLEWARQHLGGGDTHMLLVAMHKARYECKAIEPALRHASGEWLRERDHKRMGNLPILPAGELPE